MSSIRAFSVIGIVVIAIGCESREDTRASLTPSSSGIPSPALGEVVRPDQNGLERRLLSIEKEIADAEARAARAKENARFYECKAHVERLLAEARAQQATCMNEVAQQAACMAEQERQKGDTSLWAAIAGITIAVASGGAAAPWALGGAVAGRAAGELAAKECPSPGCASQFDAIHEHLMRKEGWNELPLCGGWMGINIETRRLPLVGGAVVEMPNYLLTAGLQRGDFIAYVNDGRIRAASDLVEAIDASYKATSTGGPTTAEIKFIRGERMYIARLPLRRSMPMGVKNGGMAFHYYGAKITSVDSGGPLYERGLPDDVIFAVDKTEITSAVHAHDFFRFRRAGERVTLHLQRKQAGNVDVDLELAARDDHEGL